MHSLTHYIDIAPDTGPAMYELYGRIVKAVHLSNEDGWQVTLDWPGWKDVPGCFGPTVRLLGEQAAIEHCMSLVAPLINADLVRVISGVLPVVAGAEPVHGYRRFRKPDKGSPSHQRRLERRAKARGEVYEAGDAEWLKASHRLPMQSTTTGQHFYIFIKRVSAAEMTDAKPCAYGFGVPVPRF